jgi:hypothetical protein
MASFVLGKELMDRLADVLNIPPEATCVSITAAVDEAAIISIERIMTDKELEGLLPILVEEYALVKRENPVAEMWQEYADAQATIANP